MDSYYYVNDFYEIILIKTYLKQKLAYFKFPTNDYTYLTLGWFIFSIYIDDVIGQ